MAEPRDSLRDAVADSVLNGAAASLGRQVTYSQKGATAVTLDVVPGGDRQVLGFDLEADEEDTERTYTIPRQSNTSGTLLWPPTNGPNINDKITDSSVEWFIQDWQADSLGAVWKVRCERDRAVRLGIP